MFPDRAILFFCLSIHAMQVNFVGNKNHDYSCSSEKVKLPTTEQEFFRK